MVPDNHSYRHLFTKNERGQRILQERVLMVGAGGIGCELLKNLVLIGFAEIHIVDLDTIDLSNLNRQFLFGHEHIKQPKAKVAKESASKFNHKNVKIEYYHANIKEPQFDFDFFASFGVVFNALDNVDARRHVNRMVIGANVPMVDCGTTGYQGHTSIIKRGVYPCYDCEPKEVPKSFPVCTIRSTPSQPIHCIVWAKSYLFTEIFGVSEEEVAELDFKEDSENAAEIQKLREEAEALKKIRSSLRNDNFGELIFDKVFSADVKRLLSMEEMWKSRKPPTPLDFQELKSKVKVARDSTLDGEQNGHFDITKVQQHKPWTLEESFAVWRDSLGQLRDRIVAQENLAHTRNQSDRPLSGGPEKPVSHSPIEFDKDDDAKMDFVAATASLRSHIFGIERKSRFEMKQMAGNIIPAIATTNAMFAALATLESYKVIQATRDLVPWPKAGPVFSVFNTDRMIRKETTAGKPNPQCAVCGNAWQRLAINPAEATIQHLVDLLVAEFGYDAEEGMTIETSSGQVIWDPDLQDNGARLLTDFDVHRGDTITVRDESEENARMNLLLAVSYSEHVEDKELLVQFIDKLPEIPVKPSPPTPPPVEHATIPPEAETLKRKRKGDDDIDGEPERKRGAVPVMTNNGDEKPTIIDDNGVIEIE